MTTISAYNTVTTGAGVNLSLGSSAPTVNARITATQQNTLSNTILFTALTDTTRIPTVVNGFTGTPGSTEIITGDQNVLTKNVSVMYTADSGNTIAINRQPNSSDLTGGSQNATLVVGSSGGSQLTISNADAVGLTTGMAITNIASAKNLASKAIVSGNNIVTLSKSETTSSPSGTSYGFSGVIVPGTTISSIASPGASNTNLTISTALLAAIPQFDIVSFGNGYNVSANLTAVMIETSTSSNGVITTVQNKKCHVFGTITVTSIATTSSNFSINPNFLTVS